MSIENHCPSYVLWLPSWYPCKLTPYDGDFIQRHARAVSEFIPVHVVHIIRDKNRIVTRDIEIEEKINGNLSETIIYYAGKDYPVAIVDRLMSMRKYNHIYKQYFQKGFLQNELPIAVHVHVPYKAGLIALWLKKNYGIEYYVTEHWTGYDRDIPGNLFSRHKSFRYIIKKVFQNSKCITPVSGDLGKKISLIMPSAKIKVIPNVVDERLFYFEAHAGKGFRFIHNVSSLKGQKNTEGLLKVFSELQKKRSGWECIMYGPVSTELTELSDKLGLKDRIKFTGEIPYEKVAEIVRTASAYVSFSNYENQPCSILEALCCGVPVIATRVGGIPEIINAGNGLLIDPGNEIQLLKAMERMMDKLPEYDKKKIAEESKNKFSYETVGRQLYSLYNL
jgi:glycosyltransferase involved in cell wall biosynthesis